MKLKNPSTVVLEAHRSKRGFQPHPSPWQHHRHHTGLSVLYYCQFIMCFRLFWLLPRCSFSQSLVSWKFCQCGQPNRPMDPNYGHPHLICTICLSQAMSVVFQALLQPLQALQRYIWRSLPVDPARIWKYKMPKAFETQNMSCIQAIRFRRTFVHFHLRNSFYKLFSVATYDAMCNISASRL